VRGSRSLGFRTNVLPVATAYGRHHRGIIPGKLNGVMATKGPSGCRTAVSSMSGAAFGRWPACIIVGMPQATSTFSMPRRSSPRASERVLPCSCTSVSARSSMFSSSNCLYRNRGWIRSSTGVDCQVSNASLALATASSTAASLLNGTRASSSPVAGFVTGISSVASGLCQEPPT